MLDFPNAPTIGQVFTSGGLSWQWDGTKWVVTDAGTNPVPLPVSLGGTGITAMPVNVITGVNKDWTLVVSNGTALGTNQSTAGTISGWYSFGMEITAVLESNQSSYLQLQHCRGTASVPTAVLQSDRLGQLIFTGYGTGGASPGWMNPPAVSLQAITSEAWTGVGRGCGLMVATTASTSPTPLAAYHFNGNGAFNLIGPIPGSGFDWGGVLGLRRPYTNATTWPANAAELANISFGAQQVLDVTWPGITGGGYISVLTTEAWSTTARGTKINIATTPNATAATAVAATFQPNGDFQIFGSVATKVGGGSWVAPSDPRLKTEVADYKRGLDAVLALNPIQFRYSGKGGIRDTETVFYGLDADKTFPAVPEIVGRTMVVLEPAEQGEREIGLHGAEIVPYEEPDTEVLTIDPSALVYVLINAVKELEARLAAAEAKLTQ
jgi:hypothetical protein